MFKVINVINAKKKKTFFMDYQFGKWVLYLYLPFKESQPSIQANKLWKKKPRWHLKACVITSALQKLRTAWKASDILPTNLESPHEALCLPFDTAPWSRLPRAQVAAYVQHFPSPPLPPQRLVTTVDLLRQSQPR